MKDLAWLNALGLSTYEAKAYLSLLSTGIADANTVSSKAGIPTGRVYDTLNSLAEKNLAEVQDSRPRHFKAVEPGVALRRLLASRKKELDSRFENLSRSALRLEKSLSGRRQPPGPGAPTFWNIAVGHREVHGVFEKRIAEAEKEVLMYLELERYDPYDEPMFGEMLRALERGVEIKILLGSRDAASLPSLGYASAVGRLMPFFGADLEVRVVEEVHTSYDVIDGDKVTLNVKNPLDPMEYFAVITVWDEELGAGLREKFVALWKDAKLMDVKALK